MKNIKILILGVALVFGMSSCKDWIQDVDTRDKQLEDDIYSTEGGIKSVLNGLYLNLAERNLYGESLTTSTVEILGGVYDMSAYTTENNPSRFYLAKYDWSAATSKDLASGIWNTGYTYIRNVNDFITHLEEYAPSINVLSPKERQLMLGEAYALRAYVHFDLLRLFGPVYKINSTAESIPYYKRVSHLKQERLPANEVMAEVLSDIDVALEYLAEDPILTDGAMAQGLTGTEFWDLRKYRLNFYAVKAFKARALLYGEQPTEAAALAKELIEDEDFQETFPWSEGYSEDDRLLVDDVLFAFYSPEMYKRYDASYDGSIITDLKSMLAMAGPDAARIFVNITSGAGDSDYRSKNLQTYSQLDGYYVRKYKKTLNDNLKRYMIPLIRKAELYYIVAEVDADASYIQTVLTARNSLLSISPVFNQDDLTNEFARETLQEGQLFFYYKRLNSPIIKNRGTEIEMSATKYRLPYPVKEDDF